MDDTQNADVSRLGADMADELNDIIFLDMRRYDKSGDDDLRNL